MWRSGKCGAVSSSPHGTINAGHSMSVERVILSSVDEARIPSAQDLRHAGIAHGWRSDHQQITRGVNNRKPPANVLVTPASLDGTGHHPRGGCNRHGPALLCMVPPPWAATSVSTSSPGSMPGTACRLASSTRIGQIARISERANLDLFFIPRSPGWRELSWACSCPGVLFRSSSPFCCLPRPAWPFARSLREKHGDGPATLAGCAGIFLGYALFNVYKRCDFAEMTGGVLDPFAASFCVPQAKSFGRFLGKQPSTARRRHSR